MGRVIDSFARTQPADELQAKSPVPRADLGQGAWMGRDGQPLPEPGHDAGVADHEVQTAQVGPRMFRPPVRGRQGIQPLGFNDSFHR